MPEFIIAVTYRYGGQEFRCGKDERHTKRILAGLRGRYPSATYKVHALSASRDVTSDFVKGA
jgi:hypothetical protein